MKQTIKGPEKPPEYYAYPRDDVVELVPTGLLRILDVGCGAGIVGGRLKLERACGEVIGIERDPEAAAQARASLDQVIQGDVTSLALPFPDGHFDCLVYADILEHLVDPWSLLRDQARLVRPGGWIVVSLPNVRYWRVPWGLFRGRWEYGEDGVLDLTHLRFFTLGGMREMIRGSGYRIEVEKPGLHARPWARKANRIVLGAFTNLLARQYLFRARKH